MTYSAAVSITSPAFPGPALWSPQLNILFVVDGRINTSKDPMSFGLGFVLDTLRDPASPVQVNVQVVRRDGGVLPGFAPSSGDTNYNADGSPPVTNFRFTPNSLEGWDQVWLFGDFPGNQPPDTPDNHLNPSFFPPDGNELKCLAEWMDRRGGVFAAGDHWNLGASMCSQIPRVRSMRRWTVAQGVPPMDTPQRHQTLQPNPNTMDPDKLEGDVFPQPIEVVVSPLNGLPHPLLATPTGTIETFPDHMHEGDVIVDDEVRLDDPLDIPNYDRPEYPSIQETISSGVAALAPGIEVERRPVPHVIAYARTTNRMPPVIARTTASTELGPLFTRRFGLIGAYDGDSVGLGRVVVESTWHHWFSFNLHGFVEQTTAFPSELAFDRRTISIKPPVVGTQFGLMQTYYRNMAIWLATPAQRQTLLASLIWRAVVSNSMAFPLAPARTLWAVGEHAVNSASQTLSRSMLFDLVASMFAGKAGQIFGAPDDADPSAPYSGSAAFDVALRAIFGGIASSFIKPAYDYLGAGPRPLLDRDAIARHFTVGIKQGYRALIDTIERDANAARQIVNRLEESFTPSSPSIPIALIGLRVVAERLQFPDPTDPALWDRRSKGESRESTPFSFTLRLTLGGSVVANDVVRDINVPRFEPAGGFVQLDRMIYDGVVQSGETLLIEVITGEANPGMIGTERLRYRDILNGEPSSWIGRHAPGRDQTWRLWYRIEKTLSK
jgi:hypothetical protein